MDLIHPLVQEYAEKYSSAEDALLKEVNEYTMKYHSEAVMLSGHLQGKVLEMISCMIQPRRILEIGTFTGYSGLCLAKGLTDDGQLHTIELRSADADKVNYINYYELTLPWIKKGGWILADNVLFHGEVLEENVKERG